MIEVIGLIIALMIFSTIIFRNTKLISRIYIVGSICISGTVSYIAYNVTKVKHLSFLNDLIYIDSFSVIQIIIISLISAIVCVYSYKYIEDEIKEEVISKRKAKVYYFLLGLFILSMYVVALSNNIMFIWIGLEATTISTAFLIAFGQTKLSMEAAWKYIILCSVGIGLGFVGIILFIYSSGIEVNNVSLNLTYFMAHTTAFNAQILKFAFVFILIGIGTKAGLAPMHTWLSDGHSEAPSPISAMLSGVLVNLALYSVIRFYVVVKKVSGLEVFNKFFIAFGCISLIIAAFSILKQHNYKRLLAFSTVENMGIMALGIGIGGQLAIYGVVLHSLIHAFSKTLLFLVSGNILSAYKTKQIDKIRGLIKTMPKNAIFLILGMLAITGTPPFASFISEYKIMVGGIVQGHYIVTGIYVICLLIAFAGFLSAYVKMIFVTEEKVEYNLLEKDKENILPLYLTMVCIIGVSVLCFGALNGILEEAVRIII